MKEASRKENVSAMQINTVDDQYIKWAGDEWSGNSSLQKYYPLCTCFPLGKTGVCMWWCLVDGYSKKMFIMRNNKIKKDKDSDFVGKSFGHDLQKKDENVEALAIRSRKRWRVSGWPR